ncbi:3-methyl-2-oxobutanoate hydroxymethyltransferase [Lottiidibacillus patelloidae]|uniref:3-methyl-2-oxobutanoate hydroxymethyltransferase n=1 Tax=Lottiidibacillus patelloidae TaxID=2670334 RepID=A0A263BVD9_9BACI|nr:3-methyl-2-oxobutanoate hydroxymethyltransferase [Lottiidibacillus patelloidae]OZM57297.1 3-methyl-2-oxobutanoate hydroxymethyltransferase [Lottiidibacillus patelloidae]
MKNTADFLTMKKNNEKIAMITAYDFPTAKYVEEVKADLILVGDSLGMVALGYDSTIPVTMDDMIHHTKAVKRGAKDTFIVTDMPFMSYHVSFENTMENAKRIIQEAGANAVKVEGGGEVIPIIKKLTMAGVPVIGHLGLTPQSVGVIGGYKVQGRDAESANALIEEAKKIEAAGAFALVLECVPQEVAKKVSEVLAIPTIGIGAGLQTDGQVLVINDLLSYGVERVPKFVKKFANVGQVFVSGLQAYVDDVKKEAFPEQEHTYKMKEDQIEALYGGK